MNELTMNLEESAYQLENFPELFLGEKNVYDWQKEVLREIGKRDSRVALLCCNGGGKTSRVARAAILWHMMRFPGSLAVVTAGAYRQVSEALWPQLRISTNGMGGEAVGWSVIDGKISLTHKDGAVSRCIGFSVDDPNNAEGHHRQGRDDNLLYVIDEAKSVVDGVFDVADTKCQPSRLLVMSSPGAAEGMFYRICRGYGGYKVFRVTAKECPHLSAEWIAQQKEFHGEESPVFRNSILAEFVELNGDALVIAPSRLRACLENPPERRESGCRLVAGVDFAAGGDSNVIVLRQGNVVHEIVAWKERDTMSAVGRFITEFRRMGLGVGDIWADADGLGKPMCDALRDGGWDIHRVHNGNPAYDSDHYKSRGAEMWYRMARMIETCKVVLPAKDDLLFSQLTTRRATFSKDGRLGLESKEDMRRRGISSPDRADALVLAFCAGGYSVDGYLEGVRSLTPLIDRLNEALEEERGDLIGGCHVAS